MKRLLIFGDSILRGVYYSEEAGRHRLYGERFRELEDRGCEVKNCSVMGATVCSGEAILKKRLTVPASDTTVIFEYGGNDCDFRWEEISENPEGEFSPNTPAELFRQTYGACIDYAREMGARVMLCNLVPLDAERYFRWISRGLNEKNILKWLGDCSMLYRWHESYSRTAEAIAMQYGCELIDLRSPFLLSHRYGELLSPDGIHPTVEGHRMIDRLITEAAG